MALTRKRKILLGVATGCLSYLSLGSAATYTTGTEVPTGTELVLTAGDVVNITVPSGENQVAGFSASGAGTSLVINGTQMVGNGNNLLSVVNVDSGASLTITEGTNITTGLGAGHWEIVRVAGAGTEASITGATLGGNTSEQGVHLEENSRTVIKDTTINTSDSVYGNVVQSGAFLDADGLIINNYQGTLSGRALLVVSSGATLKNSHIYSEIGVGLGISDESTVSFTDGTITTTGDEAHGLRASDEGTVLELGNGTVKTSGEYAVGIWVSDSAVGTVEDYEVTTEGTNAYGILAYGAEAELILNRGSVETSGDKAYGFFVGSTAVGTATDMEITTSGENAYGVYVSGAATGNATNAKIITSGVSAAGIVVSGASVGNLADSEITTSGSLAHGAAITTGGGTLNISNSVIEVTSNDAVGLRLNDSTLGSTNAQIANIANSHIESTGVAISQNNGEATIEISEGSVVEGGTYLLNVGAQGKTVLNAKSGSQLIGDVSVATGGEANLSLATNSSITGALDNVDSLKLDGTSSWKMTADSNVQDLDLNGGTVFVSSPSTFSNYQVLTITNLSANSGTFALQTDLVNQTGDLISVTGTSAGSHQLSVYNNGSASVTGAETLTVVETADGIAEFGLTNLVELGGYEYDLRRTTANDANWELFGARKQSSTSSAMMNSFAGGYLLNYAETQTLLQRMGELRHGEDRGGVWARVFGGKFESNGSSFLSGFDMNYSGLQVGADKKLSLKNGKGDLYLGGMFGYSKGNLEYQTGHGSIDSKTLGIYGTYIAPSGFYADLALKYGWMKNDFKVLDTAGALVTGENMSTDGLSASLEIGQKIHFNKGAKDGWYVEPQAQISMGHQSGGNFDASNGLRVDVDSYTSTLGRLGMNVGYEVKSGKNPINVYAKASYVHEFDGDVGYRLNGSTEQASFGDSWWTYGIGITAQLNKKHNVYLDIERASGGQFSQPWSVNGGYRFNW